MQNILLKTLWLPVIGLLIGLIVAIVQGFREEFDPSLLLYPIGFAFWGAIAMGVCIIAYTYICLLGM